METKDLVNVWQKKKIIDSLRRAKVKLERRAHKRSDVGDVGVIIRYENYFALLLELNEQVGGSFVTLKESDFEGKEIVVQFYLLECLRMKNEMNIFIMWLNVR